MILICLRQSGTFSNQSRFIAFTLDLDSDSAQPMAIRVTRLFISNITRCITKTGHKTCNLTNSLSLQSSGELFDSFSIHFIHARFRFRLSPDLSRPMEIRVTRLFISNITRCITKTDNRTCKLTNSLSFQSLGAAVKTREPVIESILKKGEDIVIELKQNHQTSLGLEQCITSLNEKWNGFRVVIAKQIDRLALAEKKRTFQVETKRIVTVVTEIEIWIQTIIIEHSKDPQYQSEQIKVSNLSFLFSNVDNDLSLIYH